jgi:CTP-dependent riboflavin kinase
MAYLREEKEKIEVAYPIEQLWQTIPKTIEKLGWTAEQTDETKHQIKIKTKGGFLAYPSTLNVELTPVDKKTTKLSIAAETPVTTITSIADYGRTGERIGAFVTALAKMMEGK